MFERMQRRAQAPVRGMRACALSAVTAMLLAACGGGGGDGGSPPPSRWVTFSSFSADATSAVAGSAPIALHATLSDPAAPSLIWSVEGPGEIRATSNTEAVYTPPGQEFLDDAAKATITASVVPGLGGASKTVVVDLMPVAKVGHHWTLGHPATTPWLQVAYGGGAFVALTNGPSYYRSVDGDSWTRQDASSLGGLVAVGWGDAGWIGMDGMGDIVSSPDGTSWTAGTTRLQGWAHQVVFGNGHYVIALGEAGTDDKTLFVTNDGTDGSLAAETLRGVAFGDGRFVGVGARGIETSTDGLTWTVVPGSSTFLHTIAYGNGRFVASASYEVYTSTDGAAWTQHGSGANLSRDALNFAGGLFIDGSYGGISTSSDGVAWTYQASPDGTDGPVSVAEHAGLVVAVTTGGILENSRDGTHWSEAFHGQIGNLTAVAFDEGAFGSDSAYLAVSDQGWTLRSTDARHWTRGIVSNLTGDVLSGRGIVHGGSVWVAVGTRANTADEGMAWYSVDGLSWVLATLPATAQPLVGIVHDGRRFVAVGSHGAVYASERGDAWTQVASLDGAAPAAIAFASGKFIIVGSDGLAAYSTDAVHWGVATKIQTARPGVAPTPLVLNAVTHDGLRFVAVGNDGEVARSTDGHAWTVTVLGIWGDPLAAVAVGDGVIVAPFSSGEIFTSAEGDQWRQRPFPTASGYGIRAVTFGGGRFVAVGDAGEITLSER